MFRRLDETIPGFEFSFEGRTLPAREGDSVAAALLAAGEWHLRDTPVSGAPRAAWCMIGVCFDCLVEIDGAANRQACMIVARPGMAVRRQRGARELT